MSICGNTLVNVLSGSKDYVLSAVFTLTSDISDSSSNLPRIQRDGLKCDTVYTYDMQTVMR